MFVTLIMKPNSHSVKCHDANGEICTVTLTPKRFGSHRVAVDAILTRTETWSNAKTALA
jgi:hypothetical protein